MVRAAESLSERLVADDRIERMHLLTFLKMAEPGWFMRLAVLGKLPVPLADLCKNPELTITIQVPRVSSVTRSS